LKWEVKSVKDHTCHRGMMLSRDPEGFWLMVKGKL